MSEQRTSRRYFIRQAAIAFAGVVAAACRRRGGSSGESEPAADDSNSDNLNNSEAGQSETQTGHALETPTPVPPSLEEEIAALEYQQVMERLTQNLMPIVSDFFNHYDEKLTEAVKVEGADLPSYREWANELGLWYFELMKYVGSDSGIYEQMSMGLMGYMQFMVERVLDFDNNANIDDAVHFAQLVTFDLNIDHSRSNIAHAAMLAHFMYQQWPDFAEVDAGEELDRVRIQMYQSANLQALTYLYCLTILSLEQSVLTGEAQVAVSQPSEVVLLLDRLAKLTGIDQNYFGFLPPLTLGQSGLEEVTRGETFIPISKVNQANRVSAITTAELSPPTALRLDRQRAEQPPQPIPTQQASDAEATQVVEATRVPTLTPLPTATVEAKPTPTSRPKDEPIDEGVEKSDFEAVRAIYRELRDQEIQIEKHDNVHKQLHWDLVKPRIGLEEEDEFKEEHKHIEPHAVVIHYTAGGNTQDCIDYLAAKYRDTVVPSVQFVIGRDASIHQVFDAEDFVEFHDGGPNPVAFGIEIVADDKDDISAEQLAATARLAEYLEQKYQIRYIVSHQYAHLLAKKLLEEHPELEKKKVRVIKQSKIDPGQQNMEILFDLLSASDLRFIHSDVPAEDGADPRVVVVNEE